MRELSRKYLNELVIGKNTGGLRLPFFCSAVLMLFRSARLGVIIRMALLTGILPPRTMRLLFFMGMADLVIDSEKVNARPKNQNQAKGV